MCILWERQNLFWTKKERKTILLYSERYCVSVHDMSNKELTIKIRQDKHNHYKDLFSWVAFWNVQQKQGRKHTSWDFILFCENKVSGLNLFMQLFTHHSPYQCMVLLEHCDTRLHLSLLWNNIEIITTALSPPSTHKSVLKPTPFNSSVFFKTTKQQKSKWCENHEPLFLFLSKWLCEANWGDEGMTTRR